MIKQNEQTKENFIFRFYNQREDIAEKIMSYFKIKENGKNFFDDTDPDFSPEHKFLICQSQN